MRLRTLSLLALTACAAPVTDDTDDTDAADTDATDDTDGVGDTDDTDDTDVDDTDGIADGCAIDEAFPDLELDWDLSADPTSGLPVVTALLGPDGDVVDVLRIELYENGPFASGVVPGTYELTGDNAQYATCAVCVLLVADFEPQTGDSARTLLATGGTVVLTEGVDGLVADLSDLVLEEVTIDDETFVSTPIPDGCTTTLDSVSVEKWLRETTCNDFVDNDEDGVLDCGDPDCAAACD